VAAVKLRAVDDERRQAKRNSLADKLAVEAKLADLKIERPPSMASAAPSRPTLAQCGIWRRSSAPTRHGPPMVHSRGCAASGPGRGAAVAGRNKALILTFCAIVRWWRIYVITTLQEILAGRQ
jgi:hypothetical protein